jgi:ABC-type uncharacterized transport system permease subunit
MEVVVALAKGFFCLGLLLAARYYAPLEVLRYSFIFVGVTSLGILLQRFPALKKM